jgi:response regulator NasT
MTRKKRYWIPACAGTTTVACNQLAEGRGRLLRLHPLVHMVHAYPFFGAGRPSRLPAQIPLFQAIPTNYATFFTQPPHAPSRITHGMELVREQGTEMPACNGAAALPGATRMTQDKIRIMLLDEQPARFKVLEEALTAQGYKVVAKVTTADNIQAEVERSQPDVIIADLDNPGRDTLESMQAITRKRPRPIVMFTNDGDTATIELAVKSGVTAYIVDGMSTDRIRPILDVAIMRFREYQELRNELELTRMQLSERKLIEKAKGLLMKKGMDEAQAYHRLRKMAMDRNIKIPELARSIIAAAELLE